MSKSTTSENTTTTTTTIWEEMTQEALDTATED